MKSCKQNDLPPEKYRIVVMGSEFVGKTSIITRFIHGSVPETYVPTVEDMYRENYDVRKRNMLLEVLDPAGSDEFPAMRRLAIQQGKAFILVYSRDVGKSFEQVRRLREQILEIKGHANLPIVIVCNKVDQLKTDNCEVTEEEAIAVLQWKCKHIQTSATDNINITGVFLELLSQANIISEIPRSRSEITAELIAIRDKIKERRTVKAHKEKKCILM